MVQNFVRIPFGLPYHILGILVVVCFCLVVEVSTSSTTSTSSSSSSSIVVDSPFGKIRGTRRIEETSGLPYLSFQNIPYAKPPLGQLRFAKPQPHPNIEGVVFDASREEPSVTCPQPGGSKREGAIKEVHDEDCLVLNIQAPDDSIIITENNNINSGSVGLKKVLVFIHGGGFKFGSAVFHETKSFVVKQDVITVRINYRLGILGFLSTENDALPGNYGLWDQNLALRWVKANIRAFGGDPDDVTIAGESAGGASASYQSLSPHSQGLFTRAYLQSGTATSVFARSLNPRADALALAQAVGCWDGDSNSNNNNNNKHGGDDDTDTFTIDLQNTISLAECLRRVPLSRFMDYDFFILSETKFAPCVDGGFIPDLPARLLRDDDYLQSVGFFDRSYLVASNNNEAGLVDRLMQTTGGSIFERDNTPDELKDVTYAEYLRVCKRELLHSRLGEPVASDSGVVGEIDDFYSNRFGKGPGFIEMMSDLNFLIPSMDFLDAASRSDSTSSYFLYFDAYPGFMKGNKYRGVPHGVDMLFLFDIEIDHLENIFHVGMEGEMTEKDALLKRSFSTLVGDFVKSGNPGASLPLTSCWPRYDVTNAYFLHFNSRPWVGHFLEKDKRDLWVETSNRHGGSGSGKKGPQVHSEL